MAKMKLEDHNPRKPYENRLEALRKEISSWISHWKEISENVKPRSGRFLTQDRNKGTKKNGRIIDSTGTFASRTLASGMMAGITSPARPWFRLATPDDELMEFAPVKLWLSAVEKLMREVFARSNFYNSIHQLYGELGDYSTGSMSILPDYRDVIRCKTDTIGSYMVATDGRGRVNTKYREFDKTVGQIVSEYCTKPDGDVDPELLDNLSQSTRRMYDSKKLDEWVTIVHAIEPNWKRNIESPLAKHMAVVSKHFEKNASGPKKFLRESGYEEFPNMCPRWGVDGEDVYGGGGPGMVALGDIKQLQAEQRDKGKGIARQMDPPMVGPSSLRGQGASTLPGALTFVDTMTGGQQFKPAYQVEPRIHELKEDINEVQQRINTAYYADLFLMLAQSDRREITAREIDERHEEKLLMLGPVLERLNDELLDPAIDRTFNIMERAGILPPAPEELEEVDLKVEYISILAQAQRSVGTATLEGVLSFASRCAEAQGATGQSVDVLDKIDFDQMVDEYGQMVGPPPKVIRSDDDVEVIRKGREQAQVGQQQMAAAQAGADITETMAKAGTADKNALTDVLALNASQSR